MRNIRKRQPNILDGLVSITLNVIYLLIQQAAIEKMLKLKTK